MKRGEWETGIPYTSHWKEAIPLMQVAVYVMCGGGFLGKLAAEQPGKFYLDRAGKKPYPDKQIVGAVKVLAQIARDNGLDANHLPEMPVFHNLGVF